MKTYKYSLWRLDHESIYTVTATKIGDTNSSDAVDNWMRKSWYNAASFYREDVKKGQEINASYLQTFPQ